MQLEQVSPTEPQAFTSDPVLHAPVASQQPPGHVDGPHVVDGVVPASTFSGSRLVRPQPAIASTKTNTLTNASAAA